MDDRRLLRAVLDAPDEDAPRLRYAERNQCPVGPAGARAVAESTTLANLELVDLRNTFPRAKEKALVAP